MDALRTYLSAVSVQNIMLACLFALRRAKIVYNFGLSECNRVKSKSNFAVMKTGKRQVPRL